MYTAADSDNVKYQQQNLVYYYILWTHKVKIKLFPDAYANVPGLRNAIRLSEK